VSCTVTSSRQALGSSPLQDIKKGSGNVNVVPTERTGMHTNRNRCGLTAGTQQHESFIIKVIVTRTQPDTATCAILLSDSTTTPRVACAMARSVILRSCCKCGNRDETDGDTETRRHVSGTRQLRIQSALSELAKSFT
jgi:hypothetical protein